MDWIDAIMFIAWSITIFGLGFFAGTLKKKSGSITEGLIQPYKYRVLKRYFPNSGWYYCLQQDDGEGFFRTMRSSPNDPVSSPFKSRAIEWATYYDCKIYVESPGTKIITEEKS